MDGYEVVSRASKEEIALLEIEDRLAWARLGVAEQFAWPMGMCFGVLIGTYWGWIAGIVAFGAGFYFSRAGLTKKQVAAEDAYHRAARLGNYSRAAGAEYED